MASNIVNLNELVPGLEGTTFTINDRQYEVPGDLPSKTVFEFLSLFDDLLEFQTSARTVAEKGAEVTKDEVAKVRADLEKINNVIRDKLLVVFQMRQPDLTELPFGQQSTMVVLGEILKSLGLAGQSPPPAAPTLRSVPRKRPARKRATGRKKTSSRTTKGS